MAMMIRRVPKTMELLRAIQIGCSSTVVLVSRNKKEVAHAYKVEEDDEVDKRGVKKWGARGMGRGGLGEGTSCRILPVLQEISMRVLFK